MNSWTIDDQLTDIFTQSLYKISVSPSYLLRDKDTEELRYYHASNSNALIKVNGKYVTIIASQRDHNKFLQHFNNIDLLEHARTQRPSTRYTVERILNINIFVTYVETLPVGIDLHSDDDDSAQNDSSQMN